MVPCNGGSLRFRDDTTEDSTFGEEVTGGGEGAAEGTDTVEGSGVDEDLSESFFSSVTVGPGLVSEAFLRGN